MTQHGGLVRSFRVIHLLVDDASRRLPEIIKRVDKAGIELASVTMNKPSLDDVFLSVTGHTIRDERGSMMGMFRRFRTMRQARGGRTPH